MPKSKHRRRKGTKSVAHPGRADTPNLVGQAEGRALMAQAKQTLSRTPFAKMKG